VSNIRKVLKLPAMVPRPVELAVAAVVDGVVVAKPGSSGRSSD